MRIKPFLLLALLLGLFSACATTPISERPALILIPFSQEVSLGEQAFQEILEKERDKISTDLRLNAVVQRVGRNLAAASPMPDLPWEFTVIESDQQNAFALPGGKVAVYTGLLPVCANEAGLATVLGHEIAHAIARHAAQRMSQSILLSGAMAATSISLSNSSDRDLILGALGLGTLYGITLPFSRSNESEADEIGLILMARAGYDPREAERFWTRFHNMNKGSKPPELLSTHPADETRLADIRRLLPKAIQEYNRNPVKHGLGESFLVILNEKNLLKRQSQRSGLAPAPALESPVKTP